MIYVWKCSHRFSAQNVFSTPTKFHLQLNHCKYIVNVRYNTHSYKDKDITTILMYTLIYTVQDSSSFLSIIILM